MPNDDKSNHPPSGWGNDPLTRYLDNIRGNQWATFANKRSEVIDLTTIDGMFRKLFDGAINPKPVLPATFFLRSHSAYLTACGAIMAGQVHDAQALLRVCLEQGGYAVYIGEDQARWERWMKRHDSPDAIRAVRREFSNRNVGTNITTASAELGRIYAELYDRTIDYGGHPNERGTSTNMTMERLDNGDLILSSIYLHGDGLLLDFALKTCVQVGICVLRLAQLVYPHRVQVTGVHSQLDTISRRF